MSEKYSNIAGSLASKSHLFDYATKYRLAHPTIPAAKEFVLSDAEYADFGKFLEGKEYDYTTRSEKILADLKTSSEKEKYFILKNKNI